MKIICLASLLCTALTPAWSEQLSYNMYGQPGLIDMPTAQSDSDGVLALNQSYFDGTLRTTITAQILPSLSASFRYAGHGKNGDEALDYSNWDRSFDLRFRLRDEGKYLPALAVGLNDFIGTGRYSGEYLVATKLLGDLSLSAGLGFGRLASYGAFTSPLSFLSDGFETRAVRDFGKGGEVEFGEWFQGKAAFFGGLSYTFHKDLTAKIEYSSDIYNLERAYFDHRSPWNVGLAYQVNKSFSLGASWLNGSKAALSAHLTIDPMSPPNGPGLELSPTPIQPFSGVKSFSKQKVTDLTNLRNVLEVDGLKPVGILIEGSNARIQIENTTYRPYAQALGRTLQTASRFLGDDIKTISVEFVAKGLVLSSSTARRGDFEQLFLSTDSSDTQLDQLQIADQKYLRSDFDKTQKISWKIEPYFDYSLFDPFAPFMGELGAKFALKYSFSSGTSIDGEIKKGLIGNFDANYRASDSVLPHVRSDHPLYQKYGDPGLSRLTFTRLAKPTPSVYSRISAGYLEEMYAGMSGEVLWKPANQHLGLGIEINHVAKRDFDLRFGVQDYRITTGHASVYYDFEQGFSAQLDAGRYLAGDYGATFSLTREFGNGWRMGGYFTLTNVPFEDFGEGSFDKGIFITIPFDWAAGRPSQQISRVNIVPITRDGGARLRLKDRLYDIVKPAHKGAIYREAARIWK